MPFPYEINDTSGSLTEYIKAIHQAQDALTEKVVPLLEGFLLDFKSYTEAISNRKYDINYNNPIIYTQKPEYVLYMLLIEYSNQIMKSAFDRTSTKVVVLPRCLSGPNFDLLKVKQTKIGWHRIIKCNNTSSCLGWELTKLGRQHNFEVFITMGNRFKEPNFLRVFRNLRKKFGHFGLVAVACLPELA
ncbi:MAG: DUF116 domain-containing protein, partial [Promethearchaeota archaeon]